MLLKDYFALLDFKDIVSLIFTFGILLISAIQIAPIKINPWNAILRWIGNNINQETNKKIDTLEKKIDTHIEKYNKQRVDDMRNTILVFANECSRGIIHSKEQFRFIVSKCDEYEEYIETYHLKNGVIAEADKLIRSTYQRHLKKNDFLK